jgi:phosphate transport system protein
VKSPLGALRRKYPRNISVCIRLLFRAKNIERMGDHATKIAETIYNMVDGRNLAEELPKGDNTTTANVPFWS